MTIYFLGDSVFDNSPYVGNNDCFISQWKNKCNINSELLAKDGSYIHNIYKQTENIIPKADDFFVLSVGGNNALTYLPLLNQTSEKVYNSLSLLEGAKEEFFEQYEQLIRNLINKFNNQNLLVLTIYSGDFSGYDVQYQDGIRGAVNFFNSAIYEVCGHYKVQVIETRNYLYQPTHFTNSIEPSKLGTQKLVKTIYSSLPYKITQNIPVLL